MLKVWPPCFTGHSHGLRQHTMIINRFSKDYLRVVIVRGMENAKSWSHV
jgi:hypothetical protein